MSLLPLFDGFKGRTWFFAGDAGAFDNGMQLFYEEYGGVKYVATGLGSQTRDSILVVSVSEREHGVSTGIQIVALNGGDIGSLGLIEDYSRQGVKRQ
jgi:hypothetical protein